MNLKFLQVLGVALILFSWILWGVILLLPFCKLTLTQYAIVYPVIFASTNIFWVGAVLVGKDLIRKINIILKIKMWLKRKTKFVYSRRLNPAYETDINQISTNTSTSSTRMKG